MKFFILFIIMASISCSSNNTSNNNGNNSESLKNSLIGKWGGIGEDSPVIEIRKDSIYYYQRHSAFVYKLINRDVVINAPEPDGRWVLKNTYVIGDTLFFIDGEDTIRSIRFK